MMRWLKIGVGFALVTLAIFGCGQLKPGDLPPGVPCFPGVAECGCYVKQAEGWVLRVCPSAPPSTPPSTPPSVPPSVPPSSPPSEPPPAPCDPKPPCPCGFKPGETEVDACGVVHPVCAECPPSPGPTDKPPPVFPPMPQEVVRGHGILLCSVPGKGTVCQGGLTPSQNPELPQCLNGSKPKNHPNAPPFKIAPGMVCFVDSTVRTGLCDPLTLKAIEQARKSPTDHFEVKGWRCANDPDPALRYQNPCDTVSPDRPLTQCGIDQWIEAIGGCDDLKAKYGNNHKKIAEECQKRWPASPTSWAIKGGCGLQVLDDIEARVTVNAAGCSITSCPSDDRVPLATACRARVMGEKN